MATSSTIKSAFMDVADKRVHIILDTSTGHVLVLDEAYAVLADLDGGTYLQAASATDIRMASVGSELYLANVNITPTLGYSDDDKDPTARGFFWIIAGAFSREYSMEIEVGGITRTAVYSTPDGTLAGDSSKATPTYIATKLVEAITSLTPSADLPTQVTGAVGRCDKVLDYIAARPAATEAAFADWTAGVTAAKATLETVPGLYTAPYTAALTAAESALAQLIAVRDAIDASGYILSGSLVSVSKKVRGFVQSAIADTTGVVRTVRGAVNADLPLLFEITQEANYVFIEALGGAGTVRVTQNTGSAYIAASGSGHVPLVSSLPAVLPDVADGYIIGVGDNLRPQYYMYSDERQAWIECAEYGSPSEIYNCPISLAYDGLEWLLDTTPFEGRLAGDDESNPPLEFALRGITGLSSYQGRLIILAGPKVCMSASNKPRRFFRSTVVSLLDADPIEVSGSTMGAAAFEHAIPFQRDLVLVSRAHQAVIPSSNSVLSPRNTTVVPTSAYSADTASAPIPVGRTLLYPAPRSSDFFGVMEMIPSPYTDSQYVSQDATHHLPKYMGGYCRFTAASTVANIAVFAPSGDLRSLVVHEYLWDGDNKVQQAWHTWTFPLDIAAAHFALDKIVLLFLVEGVILVGEIDPKAGVLSFAAQRRPYLDLHTNIEVVDRHAEVPAWMAVITEADRDRMLVVSSGGLAGEEVGCTIDGTDITTVVSFANVVTSIGYSYRSGFAPTPPVVRDYNQMVINTDKATLLRYSLGTKNSSEFKVTVSDANTAALVPRDIGTLYWSSQELDLGRSLYSNTAISVIPCRTRTDSTLVEFHTESSGEFNPTSLEYVVKFHPTIKRR